MPAEAFRDGGGGLPPTQGSPPQGRGPSAPSGRSGLDQGGAPAARGGVGAAVPPPGRWVRPGRVDRTSPGTGSARGAAAEALATGG